MIKNNLRSIVSAVLIAGILAGCSVKKPVTDPVLDKKARAAALKVRDHNTTIQSSKGIGGLIIAGSAKRETYKMAWAAQAPNRLRLTLMVSGHPVETIAADGKKVSFVSHTGRHQKYTTSNPDPNLNAFIGVPVRLSEMIAILLGRIPVREFDRAWMVPDRPGVIHANKDYDNRIQELKSDPQGRASVFKLLDGNRELLFGMDIDSWATKNQWAVPVSLSVYDATGRTLSITLSGIIPNAPVKESMFVLTAPGS